MLEIEKNGQKASLEHPGEVSDVMKSLKRIDGFMYDSGAIKAAIDRAFSGGSIGLFALDCIVADSTADPSGIGKIPVDDPGEVIERSALVGQAGSLQYVAETLKGKGLEVSLWVFIGDDDFQYSVSPAYTIAQPGVADSLASQMQTLAGATDAAFSSYGVATHVSSWLMEEQKGPEIQEARSSLMDNVKSSVQQGVLPPKAQERLAKFVSWRTELAQMYDIDASNFSDVIQELSLQELVSFITQGLLAPFIIHKTNPDLPLLFTNTYPELGVQHLDDTCLRLGQNFGFAGYKYGTIHLPGPEKLAKFLGQTKTQTAKTIGAFGCGDPKSIKQRDRAFMKEIYVATN